MGNPLGRALYQGPLEPETRLKGVRSGAQKKYTRMTLHAIEATGTGPKATEAQAGAISISDNLQSP